MPSRMTPSRSAGVLSLLSLLPVALATFSSKRGLIDIPSAQHPTDANIWTQSPSDLTWYYNYGPDPSPAFRNSQLQFVPMLWGASDSTVGTPFLDSVTRQIRSGSNISHVLAFNEPDMVAYGGSGVPADLAARTWKAQIEPLKALGVKLGAPAVTGANTGFNWLQNFFTECAGGCSVDFIPVHWYGGFEGLASHIGQVRGTYPNATIWVTEFAAADTGLVESQRFYNMSSEYLDRLDYVTHYSYFGAFRSDVSNVGPNAAFLTHDGKLTDIGSWYLGRSATGNVPQRSAAATEVAFASSALLVVAVGFWSLL